MKYSILLQWSDKDNAYLASFPEFNRGPMTQGATYEEAARNGGEVLDMLVKHYQAHNLPLPEPDVVSYPPDKD